MSFQSYTPTFIIEPFFVQFKKIKKDFPGLVEYIELETIFEWSIECVSADVYKIKEKTHYPWVMG